jgi:large subunit ribosomal protein L2
MFFKLNSMSVGKKKVSGRSNLGSVSCWHRGGAHRNSYKFIDFFRKVDNLTYIVRGFEYDPNRNSFLVVLSTQVGSKLFFSRILFPKQLQLGSIVKNYALGSLNFGVGNSYCLNDLPTGAHVHNIEKKPSFGGSLVRAAGCFAQVIQKSLNVLVKLPSGQLVSLSSKSRCSLGAVGFENFKLIVIGKAGRSRWLGRRPTVRGVAINPVDHPHGGGEGKSQIGRHPVSPWGRLTKGKKINK